MKKIYYLLALVLLVACHTEKEKNAKSLTLMTLNGIPKDEAALMVKSFRADRLSSDSVTSLWFSKNFIDTMLSIVNSIPASEKIDGVRFYNAKKFGKNTIVMVLTQNAGPSTIHQNTTKHKDYFTAHPQLNSMFMRSVDEYHQVPGAYLYTSRPCPKPICPVDDNYVPCGTAAAWAQAFKTAQRASPQTINTLSMWYSLNLFKKLKKLMMRATTGTQVGDGFRVYFVRNDRDKSNFIIVPTMKSANGNHEDDYTCDINKFSKDLDEKVARDPNDRGEECPVFCDEMEWSCEPPDCP